MPQVGEILFNQETIQAKVRELGAQLSKDYQDKGKIVFICVLKGARVFLNDLLRYLDFPVAVDYVRAESYKKGTASSGEIKITRKPKVDLKHKHILIVEDIVDTGLTLHYIIKMLQQKKPASLKICTLLDKPSRRKVKVKLDFCGFEIPNEFVVGYGLDYDEKYRNLPYVAKLIV